VRLVDTGTAIIAAAFELLKNYEPTPPLEVIYLN
jgi:hypothetical protein